jgi:hypothetical protein
MSGMSFLACRPSIILDSKTPMAIESFLSSVDPTLDILMPQRWSFIPEDHSGGVF